jgi:hypothetical protein
VPAPAATEPQYLDEAQQSRFADIINAKYGGPESIRQAGLLEPAQTKVNEAARQGKNVQTAQGREELLRSMFGKNRDYTQGQSKLDSLLLNTSEQGVGQLKQAAQGTQQLTKDLQKAEAGSQNLAQNRAAEIADIRSKSRSAFETGRTAEETATEERMDSLIKTPAKDENGNVIMKSDGTPMTEWDKLPEHFRQSLRDKAGNNAAEKQKLTDQANAAAGTMLQEQKTIASQTAELQKQLKAAQARASVGKWAGNSSKFQRQADALQAQINQLGSRSAAIANSPEMKQYNEQSSAAANMNENQWNLSPEEAALLGVSAGEGLYNTTADDIKTTEAKREKLITQDEFARQQALSQLAGLDRSKGLQKDLKYTDRSQAGTQDLLSSLDADAFRKQLNEANDLFEQSAENTDITGKGQKKVSRGNAFGTTTRTYKATQTGNVADLLGKAGYDFNAPSIDNTSNRNALVSALRDAKKTDDTANIERENAQAQLGSSAAGASAGASVGGPWGALVGAVLGNITQSGSFDPGQHGSNLASGFTGENSMITKGHQAFKDSFGKPIAGIGNAIGGSAGKAIANIGNSLSGVDTGAMKAMGDAHAKAGAQKDFERKYTDYLQKQGFENRANIADTDTTRARTEALRALLSRKG